MYARKHSRRATAAAQMRDVLLATLAAYQDDLAQHTTTGVAGSAALVGAERDLRRLAAGARHAADLHDIGKVAVPASILTKPGPLSDEEWAFIERHPVIGERILAAAPALAGAARIVRSTHERYDGTGYPDRLAGDRIPLEARIVSVCDAYHAMTGERPFRGALGHREALAELQRCAGTQFDATVVEVFVRVYAGGAPAEQLLEPLEGDDPAAESAAAAAV